MANHVANYFEAEQTSRSPDGKQMSAFPPRWVRADKRLLGKIEAENLSK
jgi:hypothetical protein